MNIKYKSYVYILPLSDKSAFKIGKSSNPIDRISSLKKFYDFDIGMSLLFECSCSDEAYEIESILHKIFYASKVHKEFDGGSEFYDYNVLDLVLEMIYCIIKQRDIKKKKIYISDSVVNMRDIDMYVCDMLLNISNAIISKRISIDMSRGELCTASGISIGTIKRLEGGENTSLKNILKVLHVLELDDALTFNTVETHGRKRASKNGYKIID